MGSLRPPGLLPGETILVRKRITATIRHESGQSLVVLVFALVVILGVSALAIDVSGWFVTRHHAQVAADAAALAAANYMAVSEGTGTTATATSYAQQYVSRNGFDGSNATVNVNTTAATVTVTVPAKGSIFFAHALGFGPPNISATAVASWTTGHAPYALFAYGTCLSDSSQGNGSIGIYVNGNTNLSGGVHSNGDMTGQYGNNTTAPPGTMSYGSSGGCSNTLTAGNSAGSGTAPAIGGSSNLNYPVPYNSSSCTLQNGTSCYFDPSTACTYTAGSTTEPIPAGITVSGSDITITGSVGSSTNPVVLCAPNGTITVAANNVSLDGSLYAGSVVIQSNSFTVTPPADQLGIYMTGTGTLNLDPSNGAKGSNNVTLNNAYVFAPNGTVEVGGNNGTGFIEALNISVGSASNGKSSYANNWTFAGTGPTDTLVFADTLVG